MKKEDDRIRVELTVFGRVQVVSYRYRVMDVADELNIVGKIWNKPEKTVGIIAEGDKEKITEFIERIKIKPLTNEEIVTLQNRGELIPPQPLAKVEHIEGATNFMLYSGKFERFEIITDEQDKELVNSLRTASQLIDKLRSDMYYNFHVLNQRYATKEEVTSVPFVSTQVIKLEGGQAVAVRIDLGNASLVVVRARRGYVMCGYLSMDVANRLGDIAGIVTGVKSFEDVLGAEIIDLSENAKKIGLRKGMEGRDFLNMLM